MLMKARFWMYCDSVTILKRIGKDRAFCKWLIRNREELTDRQDRFYVETVLLSYKSGRPLQKVQEFLSTKKRLLKEADSRRVFALFKGRRLETLFGYWDKKNIALGQYPDYLRTCEFLHLDMSQDKNCFPRDFRKWHDIRIDQYATAKAEADKAAKQALYEEFARVAEKYLSLQHDKRSDFVCVIARSPADLIREGEILHHCVGKLNYERRFVREESLIFFVRTKERKDAPFVTVEYSPKSRKILQCYGERDQRPTADVLHYVNKVWLPHANRALRKICA